MSKEDKYYSSRFGYNEGRDEFGYRDVHEFVKTRKYVSKKLISETFGCSDSDCDEIIDRLKEEKVENKRTREQQPLLRYSKENEWVVSTRDIASRTSSCIKMLMILFSRDIVSIADLARELETNPRNIPEYKKELEAAGYFIDTVSGRYGGYRLDKNKFLPAVSLSDSEKRALVKSFEYITKKPDFLSLPSYKSAMEKIMSANRVSPAGEGEIVVVNRQPFTMSQEELEARYSAIFECADQHKKMKIQFRSNDNVVRERIIHPYHLYIENNAWFVLAYCELAEGIRHFKFTRILDFQKLPETFRQVYSYREGGKWHDWIDSRGMKNVPDWSGDLGGKDASLRIKLCLTGKPAMFCKEYLYGKEQNITEVDKDTTILEFTAKYKYNTLQLVLGFGSNCKVLEPEWLKEELLNQTEKIKDLYK